MDIPKKMKSKLSFDNEVNQKIMSLLSVIDTFKGKWQGLSIHKGGYLKELRKIATIESTGSSTRIEGATLTDKEVEQLLKSVKINQLEKREEQEVLGYYEALELILSHYKEISLAHNYIHQLHSVLMKHSLKDQSHKGRYKQLSNKVVANYPDGSQRVIFRTTEPHLTAGEMEGLIDWTKERIAQQDLHPLLIVSGFVYEFLSIHPYQDGNGRLSRLLTTYLMLELGYDFIEYVSFEHVIESNKEQYYRALMEGQKNRYNETERVDQWVIFFLESMIVLINRLDKKYDRYSKLKVALNDRQTSIITYVRQVEVAQISDIELHLEGYSRNTIKKDLQYLVNEGLLLKTGAGRGVRYHIQEA